MSATPLSRLPSDLCNPSVSVPAHIDTPERPDKCRNGNFLNEGTLQEVCFALVYFSLV
jgi:hypothetical protein